MHLGSPIIWDITLLEKKFYFVSRLGIHCHWGRVVHYVIPRILVHCSKAHRPETEKNKNRFKKKTNEPKLKTQTY